MKRRKDKSLDFVLRHYQSGRLDTRKALAAFHRRTGHGPQCRFLPQRTVLFRVAVAAAIIIPLVVVLLTEGRLFAGHTVYRADAQTAVYTLADGTRVTLSPGSTLSYAPDNSREVEMSGKIYFEVRHNQAHPFNVRSRMGHVRVLGTKFQVAESDMLTEVYVTGGRVLFAARGSGEGVYLTPGMGAVLTKNSHIPVINRQSPNGVSWATHRFHFDNTPIDEVLADLTRHYDIPLSCTNHTKRLSGDFDAEALDHVLNIIEQTLNIKIRKEAKTPDAHHP